MKNTAKQELRHLYWLNKRIDSDQREAERLEALLQNVKSIVPGVKVMGGKDREICDIIDKLIIARDLVTKRIDEYVDLLLVVNQTIDAIDDDLLAQLLIDRYLDDKSWECIGENYKYSKSQILRLHSKALIAYSEKR